MNPKDDIYNAHNNIAEPSVMWCLMSDGLKTKLKFANFKYFGLYTEFLIIIHKYIQNKYNFNVLSTYICFWFCKISNFYLVSATFRCMPPRASTSPMVISSPPVSAALSVRPFVSTSWRLSLTRFSEPPASSSVFSKLGIIKLIFESLYVYYWVLVFRIVV